MKNIKKIVALTLALLMIGTSAFAAVPNQSLIIGDKAFDLMLLNNAEYKNEIQGALTSAGDFYYRDLSGKITAAASGEIVDPSTLPEIEYVNEDGERVTYPEGDSDPIDGELEVVEVSAIDTTKVVTVKATAPNAEEEATADVAIFAYDEEGVRGKTAVATAADVEIAEGAIEVEFEGLETGEYVAVVTVGEEEAELDFAVDFDAADAAVEAVNAATNQIQLAAALGNDYFAEVYEADNIAAYGAIILVAADYNTVAEVVAVIKTVNATGSFDDLVAELQAAANQIERFNILDREFERVDADNINAYDLAFNAPTFNLGTSSLEEIQNTIDATNAAEAIAALTDAGELVEGVTQADIDAAQDLIDVLPEDYVTTTLDSDLSDVQDLLDAVNALETAIEAAEDAMEAYLEAGGLETDPIYVSLASAIGETPAATSTIAYRTEVVKTATENLNKQAALAAAITAAEEAIEALPAEIKLEHKAKVENARALVDAALELDEDADAEIDELSVLEAAETAITNARIASGLVENAGELVLALANEEVETITLANGVYGNVTIEREVTLVAENKHKAVLEDLLIKSDDVTVDGVTANSIEFNNVKGITVTNNVVVGDSATVAIGAAWGQNNGSATITNNKVLKGSIGLYATEDFANYTITGNTIENLSGAFGEGIWVAYNEGKSINNVTVEEADSIAEQLVAENTFGKFFEDEDETINKAKAQFKVGSTRVMRYAN